MANKLLVSNFKNKGDLRISNACKGVKLLEHVMKIVRRVLERMIQELVSIDAMKFGFISAKGTIC